MEIELNEKKKIANQLHLCHRREMISPWNDEDFLARQTNTDNDDIGDNTNILEADSTSFIFLVALLAFIGQLASIFIGKLFFVCLKKVPQVMTAISRPPASEPRPSLQAGG